MMNWLRAIFRIVVLPLVFAAFIIVPTFFWWAWPFFLIGLGALIAWFALVALEKEKLDIREKLDHGEEG